MKFKSRIAMVAMAAAIALQPIAAQDAPQPPSQQQVEEIVRNLHPTQGKVVITQAHATLDLGQQYVFYGADDAKKILLDIWGNEPSFAEGVLGMVMPAKTTPLDDTWGAVITYESDGHVNDDDANKTDYDDLLQQLKDGAEAGNEQRKKDGYPPLHIMGWAEAPRYDAKTHTVIWARDIKFDDLPVDSLNYDFRALGRTGVLSVNFLSTMPKLPEIKAAASEFAGHVAYEQGFRYQDFDENLDKKAEYGVGGLIAAGLGLAVAKKFGLLVLLAKFFKPLMIAVAAAIALFRNRIAGLFGRKADTGEGGE